MTQLPEAALDRSSRSQSRTLQSVGPADSVETVIGILFRRQYPILLRVAYALLGSRDGAEDAVQEAFVSLFRNWHRLRDPEAAEAYVRAAVLNRCRSRPGPGSGTACVCTTTPPSRSTPRAATRSP